MLIYNYDIAEIIISHNKMPVNEQKKSLTNVRDKFFYQNIPARYILLS